MKKDEILELALNLFSEEGYSNVGVQKIVDAALVKKPTLYYYFKSKEGLLEAILEKYYLSFLEKLLLASKYENDIVFSLEKIVMLYYDFAKKNTKFYRMVLNLTFAPEKSKEYEKSIKYHLKQHSFIENMFEEAEKQHGNMKGRSRMYTFTFLGLINAGISYYFYTKDELDIDENSARKICKQFMHGIFS